MAYKKVITAGEDISELNNDSGFTTNTGTTTASNSQTFTNKGGNISQWTNDSGYTTNSGTTTASNSQTFTNKSGNISQWTNDSGYTTNTGDITAVVAGNGLEGGATSGSATLTVSVDDTTIEYDSGNEELRCKTTAPANGSALMSTADQIYDFVTGQGYTTNTGTLTSVNNGDWSGTDLAVANGGTGASSASAAATNLGLGTGSDVQHDSLGVGTAASGTTGEIRATNDVTAYYSSDIRLKKNVKPIIDALDKIDKIKGYEFDWMKTRPKNVHSHDGHTYGVIAQEVKEVMPDCVEERENGYLAVNYEKLIPLLVMGIRELKSELDLLKEKCSGCSG